MIGFSTEGRRPPTHIIQSIYSINLIKGTGTIVKRIMVREIIIPVRLNSQSALLNGSFAKKYTILHFLLAERLGCSEKCLF